MSNAETRVSNPWLVSAVVSIAAFMEVLDTTIANVALMNIAGSLGAGVDESTWILTSYLVSNAIVLPLSGWLSNLMGRKNFFIACIVGFTLSSFMCGMSTSLPMLLIFRLLQGFAGGGLQPTQQAIIKDTFSPEKLGMALSIIGMTTVLAPVLGPTVGGYITDNYNWRWIFFINVPFGILATILVKLLLVDPPTAQKKAIKSIDYIGLSLITIGLGALQIVLDKGQQEDWFSSTFITSYSIIAGLSLIIAVLWLWKQKDPIVDLKLLTIPSFGLPCLMMFFVGFVLTASTALLPQIVQTRFGYDATTSGMVLSPSGIVNFIAMSFAGKSVNKFQARYLISFGMLATAIGMWYSSWITLQTDYYSFALMRILQLSGVPILFIAVTALAFSKIPPEKSSNASAIISLVRNLGGSIGISIVTTIVDRQQQIQQMNLVQHLTAAAPGYQSAVVAYTNTMIALGTPITQASTKAFGHIYQQLLQQASILAYRNVFNVIAVILAILAVFALFMPSNNLNKKNGRNKAGGQKSL